MSNIMHDYMLLDVNFRWQVLILGVLAIFLLIMVLILSVIKFIKSK